MIYQFAYSIIVFSAVKLNLQIRNMYQVDVLDGSNVYIQYIRNNKVN